MKLKDNTSYFSNEESIDKYLSLQQISNCEIARLLDDSGNGLLIYPYSFNECEDKIGEQYICTLQNRRWKDGQCTEVLLQTGNMVGFISTNKQYISIHSRFSKDSDEDFFFHYMLEKVLSINLVSLSHGTINEQVFDFLLYLFPKLLNDALLQGLYKEYQHNEYNDANVRGTIDISKHLKVNIPFRGKVAYRTREFSHDNHVTELIRHTIEYIRMQKTGRMLLENNAETRENVSRIIEATCRYNKSDREKVIKDNLRTVHHPYYTRYSSLQKLCMRILRHEKIKYGNTDNEIHGILFDVSYLWEEYIATILVNYGFKHPNNKKRTEQIYLAAKNRFPRYPDYYNKDYYGTIIDAKYKPKIDSRNDVNQMLTYMYRLKGKHGVFIQPTTNANQIKTYNLYGYGIEEKAKLSEYTFYIPQYAANYSDFKEQVKISELHLNAQINSICNY